MSNPINHTVLHLASSLPVGNRTRRDLLRALTADEGGKFIQFMDEVGGQKVHNPDTGNTVKVKSLKGPKGKKLVQDRFQKWLHKQDEDGKIEGAPGGFLGKLKGLSDKGKKALSGLSEKAQKTLTDPKLRKEALASAGKSIRKAPAAVGKKIYDHFKHEVHEVGGGLRKIMQGEKPTRAETKAIFGLAVEIAAASTVISTGGAVGAAGFFGKSMVKHIALSAINPVLGDLHVLNEMGHVGHALGQIIEFGGAAAHHASGKKTADEMSDDEVGAALINFTLSAVVAYLDKGMDDGEVAKALNGDHPELDFGKLKEASVSAGQQDEGRLAAREQRLFGPLLRFARDNKKARGPILNMLRKAGYITPGGKVVS